MATQPPDEETAMEPKRRWAPSCLVTELSGKTVWQEEEGSRINH